MCQKNKMSATTEDLCRANSTGHIGVLSNQQLSESLLNERIKAEQHRLNYERLRSLYTRLQHEMNSQDSQTLMMDEENGRKRRDEEIHMEIENHDEYPGGSTTTTTLNVPTTDGPKFPVKSHEPMTSKAATISPSIPTTARKANNMGSSPTHDYLNLKTGNAFLPSLTSLNNLMDDRIEDIIPSMTAVPHNEILRQCSRWKELYLNLLDEFQHYKYGTDTLIMSSDEAVAEKVREANKELDRIRAEQDMKLEKLRFKLDSMIRDKIVLETEIKAIRGQLAETIAKLQEKTVLCEALQRQIDEYTMGSSLQKSCDMPAHAEMQNNLHAAETRVQFLHEEISELNDKNAELQDKILNIIQESTKEITTLRRALTGQEEFVARERFDFESQREETMQHLQMQQAYIEDLDKFVNERVEKNHEISKQVQDFATQVAHETEQTLQLLEDRLKTTVDEKEKLEEALLRASKVIRELTEEARRQRVTASRFITHIYQVLSIPPGDVRSNEVCELRTLPYVVLSDNIINSIDEDCDMAHTYAIDTKIHMKELLKRVIFWSRQFELQKKRLRERVTQLERFQMEQKKVALEEIDRYRKKCSFYRDILRQLRQNIGPSVVDESLRKILPPKIYEQANNWLNKQPAQEEEIQALLHASSSEKLVDEDGAAVGAPPPPPPPPLPPKEIRGLSQAQNKFGSSAHLNPRPIIISNLHNYLKKHERFVHILDNVEKYLTKTEDSADDDDDPLERVEEH